MNDKPQLGFWQIWNMCFGFLGIQMGFGLQNANVSRIFQTLGAEVDAIPILWIAAPVTGLLVQPVIGYMSDRTWNRLGRRRPFFLVGALLASGALLFMPHSPVLWVAAGMLWIMDASINITMEPFRALVGDMLPERQRPVGFAMQSFFIGVGAVIASALPWVMTNLLGVDNTAPAGEVPPSVKLAFTVGGLSLLFAVLWTILRTREYSPAQLQAWEQARGDDSRGRIPEGLQFTGSGLAWAAAGIVLLVTLAATALDKQLYVLAFGLIGFGGLQLCCAALGRAGRTGSGLYEIMALLKLMPRTMKQLAVVQFFSWFALFAMWIYTTPAVTAFHFGSRDPSSEAYNTGADWVGVLFASYSLFAALAAIIINRQARWLGLQRAHLVNMCLGGLGLASMTLIRDPQWLLLSMIGVGIAWASVVSIPYALLANALPASRMGIYMGIFNFFIVIPQILAATVLGFLLRTVFGGEAINALLMGGLLMGLAGLATLWVDADSA